jgi:hypothetical protein
LKDNLDLKIRNKELDLKLSKLTEDSISQKKKIEELNLVLKSNNKKEVIKNTQMKNLVD